jgi:hypothetical protein
LLHTVAAEPQLTPLVSYIGRQVLLVPLHLSGLSHSVSAELPHDVLDEANTSVGQVVVLPPQVSATSQTPAELRHTKLDAS